MKKMLHKMALVWISTLTLMGLTKAKETKVENQEKRQASLRQHEVILDEFEFSAFHGN